MAPFHRLTITHADPGSICALTGLLELEDGTELLLYADSRERIIAQAQERVQRYRDAMEAAETGPEVLILNDVGEIVREPTEWSVRA